MSTFNYKMYVVHFFINLMQAKGILEEGTSIEEWPPSDWPVGMLVRHFLD